MNKKLNKAIRNSILTLLLIVAMMITSVIPTWAQGISLPDISSWAVEDLNEGERYGIYPMEWYYDGFTESISEEKLETLLTDTAKKIKTLELEKDDKFTPIPHKGDKTREDVIIRLYNILAQYNIPAEKSPIDYMQERNILKGTNKGLELDKVCTTEQAVILAARLIEDTYNLLDAGSKGFAWKVEHNGNIIYFLGSIHIGNSELYPISQNLRQSFNESDALIVEANLFEQEGGLDYFMEKATYQDGATLKDNISEETYQKVIKVLEIYNLPQEQFLQFKPWSLANNLSVLSSTDSQNLEQGSEAANLGIDMYFLSKAMLKQKPIIELEGIRYQADLFDGLSHEFQENYLSIVLDSILNPPAEESIDSTYLLKEWLSQWKNGDIDGFANSYKGENQETEDEFSNMLFGQRDKAMTEKIIKILESEEKGTYFLVVGAGHFVEENTIIHHLQEKGYNVELYK
ncbi:TraB/GumN family protein [Schnuerera sp.]|uniref:TraB/GumN family protein n=1 Tax=Schnuerera sp. TaxID=2794844 RepID=UPI002D19BDE9|nr:TraB/GumN family protein [Schnuerera sp.]HSH35767.1 TraB/GumN family protein [Schnuerera sp.]